MSEQTPLHTHHASCHTTGLHQTAAVGQVEAIAALVDGGCALDLQDKDGNTALHQVSWHGFSQSVKLLLKAGANVHVRNKAGNTPLHLSCQNAHSKTSRLLLFEGSSTDTKNNKGDTCLHVAARYNHVQMVKILLKSGCSVNERNQTGDTPLHVAATLNHKKTVQLLLKFGADGKIKNKRGHTALDQARDNDHREMAILLARALQAGGFVRRKTVWKGKTKCADQSGEPPSTKVAPPSPNNSNNNKAKQLSRINNQFQIPRLKAANGCRCKAVLKRLEEQVKDTQGEMRLHMLNVQEEVNTRLVKMGRRNRQQIKMLDVLSRERASAERTDMIYRMERRVTQSKEEVLLTQQAAMEQAFNQWTRSCFKVLDVHIADRSKQYKLLRAPTVSDTEVESFPLLSLFSEDSSSSLATYVNIGPSRSSPCLRSLQQNSRTTTTSTVKVEHSPDDYENTALYSWRRKRSLSGYAESGFAKSCWEAGGRWRGPSHSLVHQQSSGSSSISDPSPVIPQQQHSWNPHREATAEGRYADVDGTHPLALFPHHPSDPSVSQESNAHHALEVTQHFFEIVSNQLEQWCQRKILEVELQAELRDEQQRKELLQRICSLEEEIECLKTSEDSGVTGNSI